ncbi:MAG: hypothetical protein LBG13_02660 [Holosporales bacterium]|nr:hypothetical protein [Holosporales bacterium]
MINKILPIISEEEEKKTEEEKKRIEKEEKKIEEQEKKIEEQKKKLDEEKKRVEEEKKRIVQVTKKTNPNQVQKQNLISLNKVIGIMDGAVSGRKSEPSGGMK